MNKTALFPAAGLGAAAGLYGLYRYIFCYPVGSRNDDYSFQLPRGMEASRARSVASL